LRRARESTERLPEPRGGGGRRSLSWGDNPLVRSVGRVPARVHTKLLVAFMATAVLVVAVGLLGLRVLGQSNTRMVSLGELQKRAFAYGKLQSAVFDVRLLLAENVSADFYKLNTPRLSLQTDRTPTSVDQATANALARIGPATVVEGLGFVPPAGDDRVLRQIRKKTRQLAAVMEMVVAWDQRGGT